MKKTLIALAILSCTAAFAQNTTTVGDNRNGQIVTGGSIANGANVEGGRATSTATGGTNIGGAAYGGVGGTVGAQTANTTGGTVGATTGGTVGATTGGTVGATTATSTAGAASSTAGAATSTSGAATTTGGTIGAQTANNSNAGVNGQASVTINGQSDAAAAAAADAQVEAARLAANADIKIRNVPNLGSVSLTSSNDTCMGSIGAGAAGPGLGLNFGTTYKDDNCVMLKNSREMWNMGMREAAMALMCTDAANKDALELTGYVCPQTKRDQLRAQQAATAQPNNVQYTDPIIRRRLGLAPL